MFQVCGDDTAEAEPEKLLASFFISISIGDKHIGQSLL